MCSIARSIAALSAVFAHDVCLPFAYHRGYHWVAKIFQSIGVEVLMF